MKARTFLLAGAAVGYVLGTRDGRGRYEQIKTQAQRLWNDPKVQDATTKAQDLAKAKAPGVQQKVADVAGKATGAAKSKVSGSDESSTTTEPPLIVGTDQPPTTGVGEHLGESTEGATYG